MTNQAPSTTADAKSKFSWLTGNPYTIPAIIAAIVFICFHYTIGNQFTNWDDDYYVTNDKYIKALTLENLKVIFTQDITQNNYHPFCMLSLAINYLFAGLNPASYYLTNILIHIANSLLVFAFVKQLSSAIRLGKDSAIFMASIAGLWFGIHPMHVESVAWIAERKDVLYTLFYIWGMITYLKSKTADNPSVKTKQYWITYIL
ncbi:MAG: hypothetical protein EBX41_01665, partial [Chitinophagia bacterium]|nr:hypothetical protein [Chitinophagia bacterium]